jgi:hypothetical protein
VNLHVNRLAQFCEEAEDALPSEIAKRQRIVWVAAIFFHLFGIGIQVEVVEQGIDPEGEARSELGMDGVEIRDLIFGCDGDRADGLG